MEGCLLCLEIIQNLVGSIQVESTKWKVLNVQNLIEKHFWPMESLQAPNSWICTSCWQELFDFHNFYERVKEAHAELTKKIQTVELRKNIKNEDFKPLIEKITFDEAHFESRISIKESPRSEIFVPEEEVVVKEEPVEEFIAEEPVLCYMKNNDVQDDTKLLEINDDDPNNDESCSDSYIDSDEDNLEKEEQPTNGKLTSNFALANNRYLKENFQIKCSLCQIQAETFYALCKHFKTEHKMNGFVLCCKKKFYRRSLLVDHVRQHVNPNYFKCTVCNRVMANRKCLIMHNKTHNVKKEKLYPCDICNKKFSLEMSLNLHKMSHLSKEEKHVPCTECDKKFASKSSLSNHVRSVHLKKYINVCEICGKSIRCKEVFERHMLQHEGKPLPTVSCDVCGLILANNRNFKQHKLMVHPEGGKKEFSCPVCSKISPNLKAHKKHIQYNHEWGNDHKCTICEKAFKTAYVLTQHMAAHTGTALYTCSWCPKTFNSNAYFNTHRKKCHRKEWEEETRKKYSGNLPPNNNTKDSFTSSHISNIIKIEK